MNEKGATNLSLCCRETSALVAGMWTYLCPDVRKGWPGSRRSHLQIRGQADD